MSAPFSAEEERKIRQALKNAGRELFPRFGIRKTTIDMLAEQAGIGKGSFYRFFPSKEELYLQLMEEEEGALRSQLHARLYRKETAASLDELIKGAQEVYHLAMKNPLILQIMEGGDFEYLMRKIPPSRLAEHTDNDTDMEQQFIELAGQAGFSTTVRPEVLAGMLRGIFLMGLHKREIGEAIFREVQNSLLEGVLRFGFAAAGQTG